MLMQVGNEYCLLQGCSVLWRVLLCGDVVCAGA